MISTLPGRGVLRSARQICNTMPTTSYKTTAIVRFAVERRVTMGMIVLGVLVLGWLSLNRLPLEFLDRRDIVGDEEKYQRRGLG